MAERDQASTPPLVVAPEEWPEAARRRLPESRPSVTVKISHGNVEGYCHVGFYPDTNQPGEIFVVVAKEGHVLSAALDMMAMLCSYLLQHGVPAMWLIDRMLMHRFDPMAIIPDRLRDNANSFDKAIPREGSLYDHVAAAILEACGHYGADPRCDHMGRVPKERTIEKRAV